MIGTGKVSFRDGFVPKSEEKPRVNVIAMARTIEDVMLNSAIADPITPSGIKCLARDIAEALVEGRR